MNWIDYNVQPFPTEAEYEEQYKYTRYVHYLGVINRKCRRRDVQITAVLSLNYSTVKGSYEWLLSDTDEVVTPLKWMPLPKPTEDTTALDENSS